MHRTTDSESLLLRSPIASQGQGGALGEEEARKRGNTVGIRDQAMDLAKLNGQKVSRVSENLLPTTRAQHGNDRNNKIYARDPKQPQNLENALAVLPTPVASEGIKAPAQQTSEVKGKTGQIWLSNAAKDMEIAWGKFEPAIKRWEATIGRPAPAPTKPDGKDGNHRLSSAFTEWMMGLPEGWITDVGLSRNEELKACGNGVVPQQAELALRVLLEGLLIEPAGGQVNLPTPTVSDTFTDNLKSSQQKPGSMHSVTLPQAVKWVADEH